MTTGSFEKLQRYAPLLGLAPLLLLLCSAAAFAAGERPIPNEYLVRYRSDAGPNERASARAQMRATVVRHFGFLNLEHVRVNGALAAEALTQVRANPRVLYVEPNYEIHLDAVPNDPRFPELYGLRNTGQTGGTAGADIKALRAWEEFTGDPGVLVGVIDTGIDYTHPDLAANIWSNPGEIAGNGLDDDGNGYVDDVHGYDFSNGDGDPMDDNGHGTHVAGTIAAAGDNGEGITGINWRCSLVAIKFLGLTGAGSTASAIAGLQYAISIHARITNNSWGGGQFSQSLFDAIEAAGAAGQLFIAAAGNNARNTDLTPLYPACYDSPYVLSVASTDHNDALSSFSNYGATTVDLAAPGSRILSCANGGGYRLLSGTSMATPHVAGVAALTMARYPGATNLEIRQRVLESVDRKPQLAGKVVTGGRLNALLSVAEPDSTPPGAPSDLEVTERGSSHARLEWTATGDDGSTGHALAYELRHSSAPIADLASFLAATLVAVAEPVPSGGRESVEVNGLAISTLHYFALRALDERGNAGPISNVASATTLGAPDLEALPASFSATLLTGATTTQSLTLRNVGEGTLDFSLPTPALEFPQQAIFDDLPLAKGAEDPREGFPEIAASGGPDGFGYRWADNSDPNGPAFDWVDITGLGAPIPLQGDDWYAAAVPIGFAFPFYGALFDSVRVGTNGWFTFTDRSIVFNNQPLPNPGAPANLVAPFWDDLDFGTTPRAWSHSDGSRFIVSWVGVPHYYSGGPYTFQAILYPTGEIRFQYLDMGEPTNSATIGLQNGPKTIGTTVRFNSNYVTNGLALRIVPLPQWLTVTPSSGRIPAGESRDVQVRLDAFGMRDTVFNADIAIQSNDPDENPTKLPAELRVLDAPDIRLSPDSLDFGTFFVGANPKRKLTVMNPGTSALVVSNVTSGDPDVHADTSAFTVPARGSRIVPLTWSPGSERVLNGTVTFWSNDPDDPEVSIRVGGESTPAPMVSVNPDSFEVSLLAGEAETRTLRVSNLGGHDYEFTVDTGSPHARDLSSGAEPLRVGGPDGFGYTYEDSDLPGGPLFSWRDVRGVGTPISLTGNNANAEPVSLGFRFPFYGHSFDSVRVCTNGWVSFTSAGTEGSNTRLPTSARDVPENLLAVFWDDLEFGPSVRAYYYFDGTYGIIQFQDVPRAGEAAEHGNTFEILLSPSGEILYQYRTINALERTSCTIGMQSATRDQGLQVVFNSVYVHDDLAIRFRPPVPFLAVSPAGGTVPPGGFMDLTIGFDAAGLYGGTYDGTIVLEGNDPVQPNREVHTTLRVTGAPHVVAGPATIDFGTVFVGFPQRRELVVRNTGTDALIVSELRSSDPSFVADPASFTVPAAGLARIGVEFDPPAPGPRSASLKIESNDPSAPEASVELQALALVPPDVDIEPAALAESLAIPRASSRTITLRNLGGSELTFEVGRQLTLEQPVAYEALELAKEETDPRPGVLGRGGPDAFGYTWRDSDEPQGPAFEWVDITTTGTPVTFAAPDDANARGIPIGFPFPFYGATFDTVNVCTNGWLSFTSSLISFTNQPLPNLGKAMPPNLLAAFWDDLVPGLAPPRIFYRADGARFVVSWVGVPRYSSGGPYTFQIILDPSGRITYQYLDLQGTRLNEATIGMQNGTRDDGLTICFDAPYVHERLAIEIERLPDYLTVEPASGTIPAGGSMDLAVGFNTTGLLPRTYPGAIRIVSNDPDESAKFVATSLTATTALPPEIESSPAAIRTALATTLGATALTRSKDLVIENLGAGDLTWSASLLPSTAGARLPVGAGGRLAEASSWLSISPAAGVTKPGKRDTLRLRFSAAGLGDGQYATTLRIGSNDLDEPQVLVPCELAVGVAPAAFDLDPNTLNRSSSGRWVIAKVTPPAGADPATIRTSSIRLERQLAVAPGAPVSYRDGQALYGFDRDLVRALLPAGRAVPIEVIGEVEDVTWFSGVDLVKVLPPRGSAALAAAAAPGADDALHLTWQAAEGSAPTAYELWSSPNDGEDWYPVALGLTGHEARWAAPSIGVAGSLLELVAIEDDVPVGAWRPDLEHASAPAPIEPVPIPSAFGLTVSGPNPALGEVALNLAIPARGEARVEVFDVRGSLVRTIARGAFEPGTHRLSWDGADSSGQPSSAGVYFVRAQRPGQSAVVRRVTLLR